MHSRRRVIDAGWNSSKLGGFGPQTLTRNSRPGGLTDSILCIIPPGAASSPANRPAGRLTEISCPPRTRRSSSQILQAQCNQTSSPCCHIPQKRRASPSPRHIFPGWLCTPGPRSRSKPSVSKAVKPAAGSSRKSFPFIVAGIAGYRADGGSPIKCRISCRGIFNLSERASNSRFNSPSIWFNR